MTQGIGERFARALADKDAAQLKALLRADVDCSLDRVGYRLKVRRPDGEFVIEQQAYLETDGEKISWLRIMCSGFLPIATDDT